MHAGADKQDTDNPMIRLLPGDCREVLATLPANSVHCVVTSPPYYGLRAYLPDGHADKHREIGSEATPDAYLAEMVAVFREVRRVLRPDGTVWCNMGDSYASNAATAAGKSGFESHRGSDTPTLNTEHQGRNAYRGNGIKPKDLLLMPARLALALQADGWWLRSDIIWHKPNPMPESVTDRPTSAHEHVFLLAKAARYYYDADAVREPQDHPGIVQYHGGGKRRDGERFEDRRDHDNTVSVYNPAGRNCRNVWTIATAPYSEAHFATFPPALAERCIRAGTSERGCCAACGAPWARVTAKQFRPLNTSIKAGHTGKHLDVSMGWADERCGVNDVTTTGWAPSCACDAATVPCTVLDPFGGAGTTALVADRLQRDAILIELNPAYTEMAMARCRDDAPLFASPPPAEDPEDARIRDLFAEPLAAD